MFAAHLGSSETMANMHICIHGLDRTRGLWPQCRSAGTLRDSSIAAKAPKVKTKPGMPTPEMATKGRRTSEVLSAIGLALGSF